MSAGAEPGAVSGGRDTDPALARLPAALRRAVERARRVRRGRPARIETPGPGQESVWDYPRPPRVEPVSARVRVEHAGEWIADSARALRVVETSSPPVYYLPPDDTRGLCLVPSGRTTLCEWKGAAEYLSVRAGGRLVEDAAFRYPDPLAGFEAIRDFVAFHAQHLDACTVGGVRAVPQPGDFYAGWITPELVGPFKGDPGSEGW